MVRHSAASRAGQRILGGILLVLTCVFVALAQSNGSLGGTVVDATGGVVPGADVTGRNLQTGARAETRTNAEGIFRLPNLPIGWYEVSVSKPGFDRTVRSGLQVLTGQAMDLTLHLQVGQSNQSVEVSEPAPMVQVVDSEIQTTFDIRSTRDLPLNGRNPLQLVVLTPGAQLSTVGTAGNQQENSGVSVNGLRALDNNYELDGALYLNRQFNSAPILPNPDALEEFTVKSSNYNASESGAGATVQLSTRSGGNGFHGEAFEFLRNNDLDARNFFATSVTPFQRNQYGGTFGGPIARNRTFFFASYQGTRVSGGVNPAQATVPTALERTGDYSGSSKIVVNPGSGQPFAGNIVPQSAFDPLSTKLLQYVPQANAGNGQATETPNSRIDDDQFIARVDHVLTGRDHLTGRYSYDEYDYNRQTSQFATIYARNRFRTQNATASDTHTFGPRLVYVAQFGFTRDARTQTPTEPITLQALGQFVPEAIANAQPELRVNVNGYFNLFSGGGLGAQTGIYYYRNRIAWTRGRHFVQFGLDIERDTIYAYDTSFASGTTTFDGSRTASATIGNSGDAFADFLIGRPNDFSQSARTPQDLYETKWQPWIQDDWKALPHLTLNLGLRWEPWLPPINRLAPAEGFAAGVQSTVAPFAPKGLLFTGDPGLRTSIFPADWNNLAPRIGFAWDAGGAGHTVVRSAFGIFYRSIPLNLIRASDSASAFTSLSIDIANPASFSSPYTGYTNPFPFTEPALSSLATYRFVTPVVTSVLDPGTRTGYTEQWNFTVERQVRSGLALSIAYVGNHSVGIMSAWQANGAVYGPGATAANLQSRRLYAGLGALAVSSGWGYDKYHGLQLQVARRAGYGLSFIANYVYSKCMDNTTAQTLGADAGGGGEIHKFDRDADYSRCDFDGTHAANVSLVYELPRAGLRGLAAKVLNGWMVASIATVRSGIPFTVSSGRDNSLSGAPNNDTADQSTPNSRRPPGANPLAEWFNRAAFTLNAIGTFGSSGRNALTGPGTWNVDAALFKRTQLSEAAGLQIRFEAFNLFNHANFGAPVSTVTNPNFGVIITANDPRVLQFGAKLTF